MVQSLNSHGSLQFTGKTWIFRTDPEVRRRLCRLFVGAKMEGDTTSIPHTPEVACDVEWFLARYHHRMEEGTTWALRSICNAHRETLELAEAVMAQEHFQPVGLALPLRHYQLEAVELAKLMPGLLIGDHMGLGKTAMAIGFAAWADARPALVVCYTHMQSHWQEKIAQFAPGLKVHIVKQRAHYHLPKHDVAIITYSKLAAWAGHYPWQSVIYDEVQELRRWESDKTAAARALATMLPFRVGLSASPVYNYAHEIYSVASCLRPGMLGTREEFTKEWSVSASGVVEQPDALGQYLKSQRFMIRRTRAEVGRELPALNRVTHVIEHDSTAFAKLTANCSHLARMVINGSFAQKGQAARELDIKLRQATGVAKAVFAAEFLAELVANGEPVLCGVWHREVIDIITKELRAKGIDVCHYTGEESVNKKNESKRRFIAGESKVMLLSLRSGAGLDGLQDVGTLIVYAELDWSPKVHEQFTGRLHRDGQEKQVTEFYLMANAGSDPVIAPILGLKEDQGRGITDPGTEASTFGATTSDRRMVELAREWLRKNS